MPDSSGYIFNQRNQSNIEGNTLNEKIIIKYMTPLQLKKFHDRFIVIDNSEYYHFGSSLNGINSSKVSSFRKIISLEEINELKDKLSEIFAQS